MWKTRHVMLLSACGAGIVLAAALALWCLRWLGPFPTQEHRDYFHTLNGFSNLSVVLTRSEQGPESLEELGEQLKIRKPEWAFDKDAPNPLPGLIPVDRAYGRISRLPSGAAPDHIPLLWSRFRRPGPGQVYVIFYSGRVSGVDQYSPSAFDELLRSLAEKHPKLDVDRARENDYARTTPST